MVKFTNQQRLEIIKNYYRNSESAVATLRALTPIFGRNNRPFLAKLEENEEFHRKIIFSDEAHFWLNGFVHAI